MPLTHDIGVRIPYPLPNRRLHVSATVFFVSDFRPLSGSFNPCRLFLRSVPLCAPILFVIEKGLLVMIVPGFVELICRRRAGPLFLLQNCK